jgi:hypothetical protein
MGNTNSGKKGDQVENGKKKQKIEPSYFLSWDSSMYIRITKCNDGWLRSLQWNYSWNVVFPINRVLRTSALIYRRKTCEDLSHSADI